MRLWERCDLMDKMKIRGLLQNNLKNIDLDIPKHKIVVFTGVSGSGKSSIVFDTIAAESNRELNETFPAYIKGKLPKYAKPNVQSIENLSPSVVVDQSSLGGNIRSTVGTISDLYTDLRVLFSRIGKPYIGSATCFSFNDPKGMCTECSGLGEVMTLDLSKIIDFTKSLNEGCILDSTYAPHSWYWNQYAESALFDLDKPIQAYSEEELHLFLYGSRTKNGVQENPKVPGIVHKYKQTYLNRDISQMSKTTKEKAEKFTTQMPCTSCHGKRLNDKALSVKMNGYSIADMCEMELCELLEVLNGIKEKEVDSLLCSLKAGISRMIEIGLGYLSLNRPTTTLSGGEAQRVKLVRYMGSSLTDMLYIFDEPSKGMHPYDVKRINKLLCRLKERGNSVMIVEHDRDVIQIADEIIDVGPDAGKAGGKIVFQGSYAELLKTNTVTAHALRATVPIRMNTRESKEYFIIENATCHNLKNVSVRLPKETLIVVTGVAGSGKSTLITKVFPEKYEKDTIVVNQKPIHTTNRSTPATYLGFFDDIRKLFTEGTDIDEKYLSFNSKGACHACKGKGVVVTELVHMSPVVSVCEACMGGRYNPYALSLTYKGKNILEILSMTVEEALDFFQNTSVAKKIFPLKKVGLSYLTLGQPLSTLSGGEAQRIKLAQALHKKGKIYILDEPTTGLHPADVAYLMQEFHSLVDEGNTVIIIEHNLDVVKQADWILDMGPEGGKNGGQLIFEGTPNDMIHFAHTHTADSLREDLQI